MKVAPDAVGRDLLHTSAKSHFRDFTNESNVLRRESKSASTKEARVDPTPTCTPGARRQFFKKNLRLLRPSQNVPVPPLHAEVERNVKDSDLVKCAEKGKWSCAT